MSIDPSQIQQLIQGAHFPIDKNGLIQLAQQHGANSTITGALQHLPDKTFNSVQDVQKELGGGLGNLGGGLKV
jgi:hypothetical protein